MPAELGEQAVQIILKASTMSLGVILQAAQAAVRKHNGIEHGEQQLKKLNMQGKQLESVAITGEDIKDFRKQLNKYSVDFSVMRDRNSGEYSVFFKGQDTDRVYSALKDVLSTSIDRSDKSKRPAKEIMQAAIEKAEHLAEQAKQQPEKHRSADRGER